jgi:GLPGLI family protein
MKKILVLIFILSSLYTYAQQTASVVHYTRTTYWTKMLNEMTYLSKQEKERYTYMFSGRDDWQEYYVLYFNDKTSKFTHSDEKSADSEGYDWRKTQYIIKRDFDKNTMTDIMETAGKTYIVEDSLKVPNWKILNDIKDVAGHICMKAVVEDTVKKQKIVAWFAQDLPGNAGPERLFGLPGIILALDINDGTVTVEATRIETKTLTQELELPKKMKGVRMNETSYQQMLRKFIVEKKKEELNPYWLIRY